MAATADETSVVEHELTIEASPETVFSYFVDPMKLVQWMGVEATLDPRPGGVCRLAFQPTEFSANFLDGPFGPEQDEAVKRLEPSGRRVMSGQFVELDPPTSILLTWGWEQDLYRVPPQSTVIEISLTPAGEGTVLRLTHRRVPHDAVPLHMAGWQHYLPRLAIAAGGGDPGPDPFEAQPG